MASTSSSDRGDEEQDRFSALEPANKRIKSFSSAKRHDVFINHRGPDVKTTLAQPLYNSLQEAGIRAYLDVEETERGDFFPSAIKKAILSATVHIAILSPRYAESAWCLAELALMVQTKARIIPLFYHVKPSDFRYIKNGVADAFYKHEEKGRYPDHDIQRWKDCLQNVARTVGYEFNRQNDFSDLIMVCNEVVSAVVKERQKGKNPFQAAKYEFGLEEVVKDFNSYCMRNGQLIDTVIGIYGIGGSGKTTLVKHLFNNKHSEFSGSTILFDVRETHVKGALTSLQSKFLNDLFPGNHHSFHSVEEGTASIKHGLQGNPESRFLIVIDDADHQKQLDALVPIDALNPNCLVIVTTRDERLLINAGVRVRYKMKRMNRKHSRELFCYHAFHEQSCKRGFENLADSFVEACGGLPLSLRVMGGHVFGKDKGYWELQLDALKARLGNDIKDTLKISYDALDEVEKQIFMDIACFFLGKRVSNAIRIWKASGWRAEHALQSLVDKCLVETPFDPVPSMPNMILNDEQQIILRMHDHLRDLGREMADNEMSRHRWPWRPEDLVPLRNVKAFQDIVTGSEGSSDLETKYSLESVTKSILSQRVRVLLKLKEPYCCFEDYYIPGYAKGTYIKDVKKPVSLFDFGTFKYLRILQLNFGPQIFKRNIEWNRLVESVIVLTNLKVLDLAWFNVEGELALSKKGETTDGRFRMKSLEYVSLRGAFKTSKVTISGHMCPTLRSLKLYSMPDLIEVDLTTVTTLKHLVFLQCKDLTKVLVNDLAELEMFRMILCRSMRELPNLGSTSCDKRVYISRCRNLQDISAIKRLKGLKTIWIAYCPELNCIKAIEQLKSLKRIWINECTSLEGAICFKEMEVLKSIFIRNCPQLRNIQGIEVLGRLENINITGCPKLQHIPGIEELKGLKEMIIAESPIISCVERLQGLPGEYDDIEHDGVADDYYAEDEESLFSATTNFLLAASSSSLRSREQERHQFWGLESAMINAKQYDVFINHRRSDVQTSLSVQLYNTLKQAGIGAFLDSQELDLRNSYPSTIKNAILSASVHIIILSPRYAESAWCLAELALMFQTRARIIPLFYHVQRSDFRYIKNGVEEAFRKHEEKDRYPNQVIQQWKECLQNLSGITGYELSKHNDDADLLCKGIVTVVKKEVEKTDDLVVGRNKVGIDEVVEDFESHCRGKSGLKDNIIGIYGMGGSGKTTLATELFSRKHSKYVGSCFLFGVRKACKNGDLTSLQTKLLNDLFYQNLSKFSSVKGGVRYIKRCLGRSSNLSFILVIDDVDQKSQLEALLPVDNLNSNSLVIITTRDERVLIEAGVRVRYKVEGMDQQHSRQLFCWHAFHKPDHEKGYEDLVEFFVKECGGLPLSLQVFGEHFSGRSKEGWKSELAEVRRSLPSKLKDVLKISCTSLEDEAKQIFMDIACFFTEKDQSTGIRIWKASGWKVEDALQILRDRCLVEVIKQDCWNEIIDEESPAFVFRMHNHLQQLGREMANDGNNNQVLRHLEPEHQASRTFKTIFEDAQKQRHRCFNSIYDESISDESITYFIGNSDTSTALQWLELNGSEIIPSWIPLEKLEGLRVRGTLPRKLWEAPPSHLKELVCKFTNCGWMEKAMLRRNWNEFTDSLGILSSLESLVIHLESEGNRKDIVIEWKSFVESVRKLNCLKTLGLSGLYINGEIAIGPSSELTESKLGLEALTLSHIGHTSKVSISVPSLKSLKLKHMEDLAEVILSGVEKLGCLELLRCGRLTKVLADALPKLEILSVERCSEIEELPNLCYSQLLEGIKITRCEELQNIIGLEELRWVESITITCCPKLQNIRGLKYLKGLKYMILSDGAMLSCVSELQELPSDFTVVMGKAATSFPKADEIAGIADALPVFQESSSELTVVTRGPAATMENELTGVNEFHNEEEAYNMLQLLTQKTLQPSLCAIILCAMVDGDYGSKYVVEGRPSQTIDLSWAGGKWVYTIMVTNRKQIYRVKDFSWMPMSCKIENGYILSVKEGQELKTLSILKRLAERLYRTDTSKFSVEAK